MTEKTYLYGKNPLKEAILAHKRGATFAIEKLFLTKQSENDAEISSLIQSNKLEYTVVTRDEIESFIGRDTVHQGICALLNEKVLYTTLDEVLAKAKSKNTNSLFVLLDELKDPHNVGAIIRSAVAFGADAILMPEHSQTQITGTVIKTSAGMNFSIPIVRIGNINTVLEKLKQNTFWTYGLTGDGDTNLNDVKFDTNTVIVIGSESDGIRTKTLELCDFKLSIKIDNKCESLNASNATAVALYEWQRQTIDSRL